MRLRDGSSVDDPRLDRLPTGHTRHLDNYPLTADTLPSLSVPVQIGINWYSNFDRPVQRKIQGRTYWTIGDGDLGRIRGGHAVCLRHEGLRDSKAWWLYYDQGTEGRCVEFSGLRMLTLMNRIRYDITSRWHYHEMQERDYWTGCYLGHGGNAYEGTSVDAAMQVFRQLGAIVSFYKGAEISPEQAPALVRPEQGISAYRWATNWQDVRTVLGTPDWLPGVRMLNSWGSSYPREVILLDAAGERVLREDGEFAVVTDR